MDWICYVFKYGKHSYLVPDTSLDEAWISLAARQSMSVERCMKMYEYVGCLNGNNKIWKL